MERLKWEYEEEMRVRSEVAELNKKFKTENGTDRVPKQSDPSKENPMNSQVTRPPRGPTPD